MKNLFGCFRIFEFYFFEMEISKLIGFHTDHKNGKCKCVGWSLEMASNNSRSLLSKRNQITSADI
jgi:hypothetical protein